MVKNKYLIFYENKSFNVLELTNNKKIQGEKLGAKSVNDFEMKKLKERMKKLIEDNPPKEILERIKGKIQKEIDDFNKEGKFIDLTDNQYTLLKKQQEIKEGKEDIFMEAFTRAFETFYLTFAISNAASEIEILKAEGKLVIDKEAIKKDREAEKNKILKAITEQYKIRDNGMLNKISTLGTRARNWRLGKEQTISKEKILEKIAITEKPFFNWIIASFENNVKDLMEQVWLIKMKLNPWVPVRKEDGTTELPPDWQDYFDEDKDTIKDKAVKGIPTDILATLSPSQHLMLALSLHPSLPVKKELKK